MKTATLVRSHLPNFRGIAHLFKCDPPMVQETWEDEGKLVRTFEYVIVSAAHVLGIPETYIFGANEDGTIKSWSELEGSRRGVWAHHEVLREAGYQTLEVEY